MVCGSPEETKWHKVAERLVSPTKCSANRILAFIHIYVGFYSFFSPPLGKKEAQMNLPKQLYICRNWHQRLVAYVVFNFLAARRFKCLSDIMFAICPDFVVVRIATSRVWCMLRSKTITGQQEPSSFSQLQSGHLVKDGTRLSSHFWLTHWLVTGQQPTNRARNQKDGQQLTSTMDARH